MNLQGRPLPVMYRHLFHMCALRMLLQGKQRSSKRSRGKDKKRRKDKKHKKDKDKDKDKAKKRKKRKQAGSSDEEGGKARRKLTHTEVSPALQHTPGVLQETRRFGTSCSCL
eukprot:GHRQ01020045.1.p4 GENE.GHRQ01020045.1~~GHRQ01020045.1.p4  ORF type:complete len:112 (+),score=50.66 GHRQ01020045.1:384-719(+)